jgi:hypothetical protein
LFYFIGRRCSTVPSPRSIPGGFALVSFRGVFDPVVVSGGGNDGRAVSDRGVAGTTVNLASPLILGGGWLGVSMISTRRCRGHDKHHPNVAPPRSHGGRRGNIWRFGLVWLYGRSKRRGGVGGKGGDSERRVGGCG